MRWQDLVDISIDEFNRLTKSELKEATQVLASAGNKRLKRMQAAGVTSPSAEHVLKRGKFSTEGKTFQQLKNEYMRAKNFLQSRTGGLREMARLRSESMEALEAAGVIGVTAENYGEFWRAYEELKKSDPSVANAKMKYLVLQEIADKQREGKNFDEIVTETKQQLQDIYEQAQGWVNAFEEDIPFEIGYDDEE